MDQKTIYRRALQKQLKLDDDQCDMHYDIVKMPTNEWPADLQEFVAAHDATEEEYGPLIAQWIKNGGTLVDPFAGESDVEAERGRIEALMSLGGHPKMDPNDLKKLDKKLHGA